MKTIVRKGTNVSLYLVADDVPVTVGDSITYIGGNVDTYVCDCKTENAMLHESATVPDDWVGHRYLFDGTSWTPNPNYVAPKSE